MRTMTAVVRGTVRPQGSKSRGKNGGLYESNVAVLRPWRQEVVAALQEAMKDTSWNTDADAVMVRCLFSMKRPKKHYRTGTHSHELRPDAPGWCSTKPDLDKACRAVLDALTIAGAIRDDCIVARLMASKIYANTPGEAGVMIIVSHLDQEITTPGASP